MKAFKFLFVWILVLCTVFSFAPAAVASEYKEYAKKISSPAENQVVDIDVTKYSANGMKVTCQENYQGQTGFTVITGNKGEISWEFEAPVDGAYCLKLDYFPLESKNSEIEIGIKIDGKYPFSEAENVILKKLYKNENNEKQYDNRGNEILSEKVQAKLLINDYVRNFLGDFAEPYYFDLSAGKHTLTFVGVTDSLAMRIGIQYT